MNVATTALTASQTGEFAVYCRKHRSEVDDSFLYEDDLEKFQPDDDNPTYIVKDGQGVIVAAASLIADAYNRRGRKARFRIFHSEIPEHAYYEALLHALLKHTDGLDKAVLFVPMANEGLKETVEKLGFDVERFSFLLVREQLAASAVSWPEGFELRAFQADRDEESWCLVRNAAFAALKGSETPITPDMVKKLSVSADAIDGGMMLLYHEGQAVGLVRCADDHYEDAPIMNIGPLAVLPGYQGKGLGGGLLREALLFAKEKGYNRTILCVNAENERAQSLYLQEGFKQTEAAVCYQFRLRKESI